MNDWGYKALLIGSMTLALFAVRGYVKSQDELTKAYTRIDEQRNIMADTANNCTHLNALLTSEKGLTAELKTQVADLQAELHAYEDITLQYVGQFYCTAYCCEKYPHVCGTGTGITASGAPVTAGVSIALSQADLAHIPFGSIVYIEGIGTRIVQDTGSMGARHIDIAVPTHAEATTWDEIGNHRVFIITEGR